MPQPSCYPCLRTRVTHVSGPYTPKGEGGAHVTQGQSNIPARVYILPSPFREPPKRTGVLREGGLGVRFEDLTPRTPSPKGEGSVRLTPQAVEDCYDVMATPLSL